MPTTSLAQVRTGICRVEATRAADLSQGTGFLLSARWALTAAHVIYDPHNAALEIRVKIGGTDPVLNAEAYLYPGYETNPLLDHDIALLNLAADAPASSYKFSPYAYNDAMLQAYENAAYPLHLAGFPAGAADLVACSGPISGLITPTSFCYAIDTEEGQSGSPVYYESTSERFVMAVHVHGEYAPGNLGNGGARITDAVMAWIKAITGIG